MPLATIFITNIRVYEKAQFVADPNLNLIIGRNAGGKSTLLEAIYLLGTGRSFRTSKIDQLLRHNSPRLSVVADVLTNESDKTRLGFVYGPEFGKCVSLNGVDQTKVSQLALHLPLQAISPDTHYEFLHSSKYRRGILDWCLFHVEQDFKQVWARYQRVLQQRNAALKNRANIKAINIWDAELIDSGERIHNARKHQIECLLPYFQKLCRQLLEPNYEVQLLLDPGWNEDNGLSICLDRDFDRDSARGFTHSGPHVSDIQILLNSKPSKACASHGQYKLLVIALRLAQIQYLCATSGRQSCLLIDDLAAELDPEHRARLSNVLSTLPVQIFTTATDPTSVDRNLWPNHKAFHVEQGEIREC
jgi:DNA replication and repair protein RecF